MTVRLTADVAMSTTDFGTVLLDGRNGEYFQLNSAGAVILEYLLAGRTPAQIAEALQEEFDIDAAAAEQDASALLAELRSARLIEESP